MISSQRYDQRGVSASKDDVHNAIKNIDKGIFPKAFCKIVTDILTNDPDYCNIMHADGAGTKSSLAYNYWKETGDISVWQGIAQDAIIMNLDDLLCVGAIDNILLSSTIGRNKNLIPGEVIAAIINGTEEILSELREAGIGIYSTGGDRKSTRLNSSHQIISYAVFCLKKKNKINTKRPTRRLSLIHDTLTTPTKQIIPLLSQARSASLHRTIKTRHTTTPHSTTLPTQH